MKRIVGPRSPEATIKSYIEVAIKNLKRAEPEARQLMAWEDSIMVTHPNAPTKDFDVIVHLIPGNRFQGAAAVVFHPELGHWAANLIGPRQWNVGKVIHQRTVEQMKSDVERGRAPVLWPHLNLGI